MTDAWPARGGSTAGAASLPAVVAAAATYALLAIAGLLIDGGEAPGGHWLANPFAAIALVEAARRERPLLAGLFTLGALGVDLVGGAPLAVALSLSLLNLAEFGISALVLTRILTSPLLRRRGDLAVFIAAVAAAAIAAPSIAATGAGLLDPAGFRHGWLHWWAESSLPALLAVVLYFTGRQGGVAALRDPAALVRVALFAAAVGLAALPAIRHFGHPFVLVQLPLLLAAAVLPRFGTGLLAVATAAGLGTLIGPGFDLHPTGGRISRAEVLFALQLVAFAPACLALAIDELRRGQKRLAEAEERWKFALENSEQGVWDNDLVAGRAYHSKQWKASLGYGETELDDRPTNWLELMHPDDREAALAADRAHQRGLTPMVDIVFRMQHRAGHWLWIRDRGKVVSRDGAGNPTRMIGTHQDITEDKEREADQQRLIERLRLANAHIEQFAAIASHDLQAPLRQIALWADLLRRDGGDRLEPTDLEVVDRIQRRARQMRRMIVGLLEFSRAGADIELVPVDLGQLAAEIIADYAGELADIGGAARVGDMPRALADPLMAGQILGNLISNAIKYRGTRPLEITIEGEEQPGSVVVTIRDNGIGIEPAYADTVFELFRRLPNAAGLEGSGIGLAVCQRMADAMGGSISLDTRQSGGSMFTVRFRPVPGPRQKANRDAPRSSAA